MTIKKCLEWRYCRTRISHSEEWQIRILRAALIGISSFMILSFFLIVSNEILVQNDKAGALPVPNLLFLSLFMGMLLAVSSVFFKVPVLSFEQNADNKRKIFTIEWKIRLIRAILITSAIFICCLVIANALTNILLVTSGGSISAYEGSLFLWSVFLGLASILFEAPSEFPSLSMKYLSPNEKAKAKKIAIFFLSIFVMLNLLIYLIPYLISGRFPELAIETIIGISIPAIIFSIIITMGFVLILTLKSAN